MTVVQFPDQYSRKEVFEFPEGKLTIEVNENEPPLNVRTAIYFLTNVQYQIHRMMDPERP
jgi:hypothetical protein